MDPSTNVVVLKPRSSGRFTHTVYQEDLEELLLLSRYFSEARERWENKREYIRSALASGARVEEGIHSAKLVATLPSCYTIRRAASFKLVVR